MEDNFVDLFLESAEEGHAEAQFNLARYYYFEGDYLSAMKWYRKSAEQGHIEAQCDLGEMLYEEHNYAHALIWFMEAANGKHARAMYNIGNMYLFGDGVNKNESLAMAWYEKAVKRGYMTALGRYEQLSSQGYRCAELDICD